MRLVSGILAALSLSFAVHCAHAQEAYPQRTVRLIAAASPGSPLDIMGRLYAQKMSAQWGKPVVVDNRVGAMGIIGMEVVAKAPADGYTLAFAVDVPLVIAPLIMKLPYQPKTQLVPVAGVGATMNMLVINPSLNAGTMSELIALARSRREPLTYSSIGHGSPAHLCMELLKKRAGIELLHVPYKGSVPALTAVLAGEVGMFCGPITLGLPHVKTGKLKALGVTGTGPSPLFPELRPLVEQVPGLTTANWYAVFAPAGTSGAVLSAVHDAMKLAYADKELQRALAGAGIDSIWQSAAEVQAAIDRDSEKWADIVRSANIKAE